MPLVSRSQNHDCSVVSSTPQSEAIVKISGPARQQLRNVAGQKGLIGSRDPDVQRVSGGLPAGTHDPAILVHPPLEFVEQFRGQGRLVKKSSSTAVAVNTRRDGIAAHPAVNASRSASQASATAATQSASVSRRAWAESRILAIWSAARSRTASA